MVDNRAGASGNIGAELVAKSPADGYTLLMGATGILSINDHLYGKLNYNAAKDFVPVSLRHAERQHPRRGAGHAGHQRGVDLVQLAKTRPGHAELRVVRPRQFHASVGRTVQVDDRREHAARALQGQLGSADRDLLGGNVTMLFDNAPSSIGFVQQGQARARCAVTSRKRLPGLPNVPHAGRSGRQGLRIALVEWGVVAPAATPRAIVMKLNRAIDAILKSDGCQGAASCNLGVEPVGGSARGFRGA